ncbi:MAG: hypothetical protein FJ271_15360 [Planctomycetes bacterium]|nr:hypothetical protein [Planctomycetota bacterium]
MDNLIAIWNVITAFMFCWCKNMRNTMWFSLGLATLMPVGARLSEPGSIDQLWVDKAKTEGKACYERYLRVAERLEEECEWQVHRIPGAPDDASVIRSSRERTLRLGRNMIVEKTISFEDASWSTLRRLECNNSHYHFELQKANDGSAYALVDYGKGRSKYPLIDLLQGLHGQVYYKCRNSLAALGALEVPHMPVLKSVRYDAGTGWLHIEYGDVMNNQPTQNLVILEPARNWRVAQARTESKLSVVTSLVTYGVPIAGVEFPAELKTKIAKGENRVPTSEMVGRVVSVKQPNHSEDDFRLTAFGLPEPVDVPTPPPSRWYLWVLLVAGVSAALAVAIRWQLRTGNARRQERLDVK